MEGIPPKVESSAKELQTKVSAMKGERNALEAK